MLLRACRSKVLPNITFFKSPVLPKLEVARFFGNDGKQSFVRSIRSREIKAEKVIKPFETKAFNIGKGAVAGGAALGLGALCFYGLGLSSESGAIDDVHLWPQYVKDRIRTTYLYTAASVASTVVAAAMILRSPNMMRLVANQSGIAMLVTLGALVMSSLVVHRLPYEEGKFSMKHVAWLAHTAIVGSIIAPLYLMGGALVLRAGVYTAGIVGGLSTIAACAPSEKFLQIAGPLAIGFGAVFATTIATYFIPPTTVLGSSIYSFALYGGLILFSFFILHDTQNIIKKAKTYPKHNMIGYQTYDPINNALSMYANIVNIFIRVFDMLRMKQK